jgi:hypothetical protein
MSQYLNFRTGEVREITQEENARMAMEWAKRCIYRNGVCYVDCVPPDDDHNED